MSAAARSGRLDRAGRQIDGSAVVAAESAIAVFVPAGPGPVARPDQRPLGRAALELGRRGQAVVFCTPRAPVLRCADGGVKIWAGAATAAGWAAPRFWPVAAAYCRVSRRTELERIMPALALLQRAGVAVSNPLPLVALCRDKLRWARTAKRHGLAFAPAVAGARAMWPALQRWRVAYLKPRYGACGRDVVRLQLEGGRASIDEGAGPQSVSVGRLEVWLRRRDNHEPQLLQRAVPLPPGRWRAICLRSLLQRSESGHWVSAGAVVRSSTTAIAGNVATGAEVTSLAALTSELGGGGQDALGEQLQQLDARVAAAIDADLGAWAPLVVEVGIDYVPDRNGRLWGIEVNDTPRGRLALAAGAAGGAMLAAHQAAMLRPLQYLAAMPPALTAARATLASLAPGRIW